MSVEVEAGLEVDDGAGATRALSVDDFKAAATGAATETSLAAIHTAVATASKQDAAATILTAIETSLGGTLNVADATGEAKLEAIRLLLAGTIAVSDATAETKLEAVRALLAGALSVTVTNPTADPETGLAKDTTVAAAKSDLDSLVATAGSTADAMTAQTMIGLLKKVVDNTSNIKTDLDSIQISDSNISLEVGGVETRIDTSNAALGAPGDTSSANTIIGRLKALIAALGSPAQDATVSTGNTSLASILSAAGATGDASSASTLVGLLKAIKAALTGTLLVDSSTLATAAKQPTLVSGRTPVDPSGVTSPVSIASTVVTEAAIATDRIQNAGTSLTPKFAFANVAASQTDSQIVAAVTAKKIRVLAVWALAGATATDLTFNSKPAGAGAAKSAKFANAANGGEVLPFCPVGWFETVAGEGLTVTTGAGSTTGIQVVYVEV